MLVIAYSACSPIADQQTVIKTDSSPDLRVIPTRTEIPVPSSPEATKPNPATPKPTISWPDVSIQEDFEGEKESWQVYVDQQGGGDVGRSEEYLQGSSSVRVGTKGSEGSALVFSRYFDAAYKHAWGERPGTWVWQSAAIYIPAETISTLRDGHYITLAGFWPDAGGPYGWFVRLRENGSISVIGYTSDGIESECPIFAQFPSNRWVSFEIGLHSQNGPGVKRALALMIDGHFFGWFHQGHMTDEVFNRVGMGILSTNIEESVELFIDRWTDQSTGESPIGVDFRPSNSVYEKDFRSLSGENWQVDWSTWANNLDMHPVEGLYSKSDRLQSGINLDLMGDLSSGWAEIEIGWPQADPPHNPNGYFGPMIAFRKETNREENLEVIPFGDGKGGIAWVLEAWVEGSPLKIAQWYGPEASDGGSSIPEPGDILRVKWEQRESGEILVKASYFDASDSMWYEDMITKIVGQIQRSTDFNDGYHDSVAVTIDSPDYSIRRFAVGSSSTWPGK